MNRPCPPHPKLVLAAQSGDKEALRELYQTSIASLYRFSFYLCGDEFLAHEICQQTFVKVLKNIKRLKEPQAFQSWLFTTARHVFLDYVKSPKNQNDKDEWNDKQSYSEGASPNPEILSDILTILSHLEPDDRALVILLYREENSVRETAEILGISEDAIRWRIGKISKLLDKILHQKTGRRSSSG